jgi:hypothetical protein
VVGRLTPSKNGNQEFTTPRSFVSLTRIDAVLARVGATAMGPTVSPATERVDWHIGSCFVAINPGVMLVGLDSAFGTMFRVRFALPVCHSFFQDATICEDFD